jgi:hypothetical protein
VCVRRLRSKLGDVLPAVADGVPGEPPAAARRDWRGVLERRPQDPGAGQQDVGQRW